MKKKFAFLLLALALCASCLSACAASRDPEREPWHPPVSAASNDPAPT